MQSTSLFTWKTVTKPPNNKLYATLPNSKKIYHKWDILRIHSRYLPSPYPQIIPKLLAANLYSNEGNASFKSSASWHRFTGPICIIKKHQHPHDYLPIFVYFSTYQFQRLWTRKTKNKTHTHKQLWVTHTDTKSSAKVGKASALREPGLISKHIHKAAVTHANHYLPQQCG